MAPNAPTIPESTIVPESYLVTRRRFFTVLGLAWGLCLAWTGGAEWLRFREAIASPTGWGGWFFDWNVDTTPYFVICLMAPLLWYYHHHFSRRTILEADRQQVSATNRTDKVAAKCGGALCVGILSVGVSIWVAWQPLGNQPMRYFGELPPAYHDEYSYLFQAETFLAGRTWFPSHAEFPQLFDQVHVLNEGKFASRYFPGTGLWIAPFLAIGHPHWGHWFAGGLTAAFVFLSGWELGGRRTAWWGGLLTAFSPGLALFSNLLLSHHPTLAGLCFFHWQFLRMLRTRSAGSTFAAGCGLSFAMLCRPMTAAGFGFPFGVWFLMWCFSKPKLPDDQASSSSRSEATWQATPWRYVAMMGTPLLVGVCIQILFNASITGKWNTSPYQQYTDIYTPRHVYGFNNVVRGEQMIGPKVLEHYDRWAENLDGNLAIRNVGHRLLASGQWTWGLAPLAMGAIVVLGFRRHPHQLTGSRPGLGLTFASIISLHVAHVPYWYDGIMHWHYVFETAPLWLLILACASARIDEMAFEIGEAWAKRWWRAMVAASLLVNFAAIPPLWPVSRIDLGVNNLGFSRIRYAVVRELIEQAVAKPAVVFVIPDASDRHIDFVTNGPRLDAEILYARWKSASANDREKLERVFPGRRFYVFDAARKTINEF
ncbi:MAG: ArnT family glycosyltransferase [Planctomycetaceae bacterium]